MTKRKPSKEPRRKLWGIPQQPAKKIKKGGKMHFLTEEQIESLQKKHQDQVRFSFIYFNREHDLFTCGKAPDGWFLVLFDNLKEISKLTKNEFLFDQKYKNHYDTHQHDWEKQDETRYYPLPDGMFEQIKDDCWQFRLSTSNGRVHGFMIENVFYIVWLDPHHNFYPDEKFGGEKYFSAPLTPFQELELEYERLKEQITTLKEEKEELYQMLEDYEKQLIECKNKLNDKVS
jgi:hypothetical protein